MDEFKAILEQWLPVCTGVESQFNAINIFNQVFGAIMPQYLAIIEPIRDILADRPSCYEMISSGAMCFFGVTLMAISNDLDYLSFKIGNFINLYLLIDYIFDDNDITHQNKRIVISYLKDVLTNNETNNKEHDSYCLLLKYYLTPLIEDNTSRNYMTSLFHAEVDSIKIQTQSDLCRDDYLSISRKKGGLTLQAIKAILGGSISTSDYELGACIQLVDDLLDAEEDHNDGITTTTTYDIKHKGTLDDLVIDIAKQINTLGSANSKGINGHNATSQSPNLSNNIVEGKGEDYAIFKISLLALLIHGIDRLPYFTEAMKSTIRPYNWIPSDKLSVLLGKQLFDQLKDTSKG